MLTINRFILINKYFASFQNELTGEFTTIMIHPLSSSPAPEDWMRTYAMDFHKRFLSLLSFVFKVISMPTCMLIFVLLIIVHDIHVGT